MRRIITPLKRFCFLYAKLLPCANAKGYTLYPKSKGPACRQAGFTLVELIIVMGIFSIIIGIATLNLLGAQRQTSIGTTVDVFIAEFKQQQLNAMTGTLLSHTVTDPYGIYFESDSYTLFKGSTYVSNAPTNTVIELPPSVMFSALPATNPIVFSRATGEISQDVSVTFSGTEGSEQRILNVNQLGVIYQVN